MRNIKFTILDNGHTVPVKLDTSRGYDGDTPIIEIHGIPGDISDVTALRTYERCIIMPIMHAEMVIPWDKIAGAREGQIVHLTRGRPVKVEADKSIRLNITLSPAALALINAQAGNRSGLIEQLIIDRWGGR